MVKHTLKTPSKVRVEPLRSQKPF